MLNITIYILLAILIIVCALLLLVVLMQRPKQEGLGASFGSQMTDQAFGAQTSSVLKKATVFFGTSFMVICFILSILFNRKHNLEQSDLSANLASEAAITQSVEAVKVKPEVDDAIVSEMLKAAEATVVPALDIVPAVEVVELAPAAAPVVAPAPAVAI